jgi:hypothetical protein
MDPLFNRTLLLALSIPNYTYRNRHLRLLRKLALGPPKSSNSRLAYQWKLAQTGKSIEVIWFNSGWKGPTPAVLESDLYEEFRRILVRKS